VLLIKGRILEKEVMVNWRADYAIFGSGICYEVYPSLEAVCEITPTAEKVRVKGKDAYKWESVVDIEPVAGNESVYPLQGTSPSVCDFLNRGD